MELRADTGRVAPLAAVRRNLLIEILVEFAVLAVVARPGTQEQISAFS